MTPFSWGVALLCFGVVACAVPPCVRAVKRLLARVCRVRAFVEASAWGCEL